MTNIQASEASFFNRGSHDVPVTDVSDDRHSGHGRRNLGLALTAAAVTAIAVGGVQYARTSNSAVTVTPTSNLAASVQVQDAYVPGGSVYDQQVPAAAQPDLSAYNDGGSIYSQQVPAAAQPDLSAYNDGGSIYSQQVPAAVGNDLSAYAPGGSVYIQQVPQQ
jgi:hypothetical protein